MVNYAYKFNWCLAVYYCAEIRIKLLRMIVLQKLALKCFIFKMLPPQTDDKAVLY